jgi:lipoyl(octanoyl) transferase
MGNVKQPGLEVYNLPITSYDDGLRLQQKLVIEVQQSIRPDTLLLLEHSPVITLGRGWREENVLKSHEWLTEQGIDVRETNRGGDVTFHGPGQLVGYPIIDLGRRGEDLHRYLRDLEQAIVRSLTDFGVQGTSGADPTGVWVNGRKIAAIGIHVQRWVTSHGFALNVNSDLSAFDLIVPCGLVGREVTSLERELGCRQDMDKVTESITAAFSEIFACRATTKNADELLQPCNR